MEQVDSLRFFPDLDHGLEEPQAALAFRRLMVQLLGERATHLMRTVQALQR